MDTKDILAILEKFNNSGLAEMKYKEGSVEFILKRHSEVSFVQTAPVAAPVHTQAPNPGNPAPSAPPVPAASASDIEVITSPIVGTVYRSAAPDAPAFVDEGKVVKKGDTLCIIEAMKVMNELEAEFDCEIVKIMVGNQTFVEYGTPLFEVRRK